MESGARVLLAGVGQPGRTWAPPSAAAAAPHVHPVDVGVAVQDEVMDEFHPCGAGRRGVPRGGRRGAAANASRHPQVHLVHLQPQLLIPGRPLLTPVGGHGAANGPRESAQPVEVVSSSTYSAPLPPAASSSMMVGEIQDGDELDGVSSAAGGEAVAEGEEGVQAVGNGVKRRRERRGVL